MGHGHRKDRALVPTAIASRTFSSHGNPARFRQPPGGKTRCNDNVPSYS